jgi:hypothetical protein
MARPTDRQSFTKYCLMKLGAPVIDINVDVDQVDDRVDEALSWWYDYHFDGSDKAYYRYEITDLDRTNRYITLPDNIIGAVSIFDAGSVYSSSDMFSFQYQFAQNDLYQMNNTTLVPYVMSMQYLALMQEVLVGKTPIRYNRHKNQLQLDMNWDRLQGTPFLIVEAYQIVDPEVYTSAWNDRWLKEYATALIKQQWGNNLKKYQGMLMPGGIQFNGQQIYDEATADLARIQSEVLNSYSLPVTDMIG